MKQLISSALMFFVVVVSGNAAGPSIATGEGVSFKDEQLGMSLSDFCARYDRKVGSDARRAPMLKFGEVDFTKSPVLGPSKSYRESAKIVAEKNFPYEKAGGKMPGYPETIAGVPAEVSYEFFAASTSDWDLLAKQYKKFEDEFDSSIDFKNGNSLSNWKQPPWRESPPEILSAASRLQLGSITVHFAAADFESVVSALTERYGPPADTNAVSLQDEMGAKFPSRQIRWVIGQDQINAAKLPTVDYAQVRFYRQAVIERGLDQTKKQIEDASKDL